MKRTGSTIAIIFGLFLITGVSTSCSTGDSSQNDNKETTDSIAVSQVYEPVETPDGWKLAANGAFSEDVDVSSVHNSMSKLIDYPSYRISILCSKGSLAGSQAMTVWIFKKENGKVQYLKGEHNLTFGDLPPINGVPAEGFSFPEELVEKALAIMDKGNYKTVLTNSIDHTTIELKVNNQTSGAIEAWRELNK